MLAVDTTTIKTYLDNSIISNVSYGDLSQDMNTNATEYMRELTRTDKDGKIKLSTEEAMAFAGIKEVNGEYQFITEKVTQTDGTIKDVRTKGYEVIDSYTDPDTGYNGTLLKNNETGEFTFTNRGTEGLNLEDNGDNTSLIAETVPEQYLSMYDFIQKQIDDNVISADDNVTMSGHSLGGALTQMGTAAFSDYIDQAYTYNSPGAKDLDIKVMHYQGEYLKNYEVLPGGVVTGERISEQEYNAYKSFLDNKDSLDLNSKITNII